LSLRTIFRGDINDFLLCIHKPNRVLDLILDAFEQQPTNLCFLPLLRRFHCGHIVHVLGFKFSMHHLPGRPLGLHGAAVDVLGGDGGITDATAAAATATGAGKAAASSGESKSPRAAAAAPAPITTSTTTSATAVTAAATLAAAVAAASANPAHLLEAHSRATASDAPRSLYLLAAVLVMHELVSLGDLLPYLRPSMDRLQKTIADLDARLVKQVKAYGVVSLNSSSSSSSTGGAAAAAAAQPAKQQQQSMASSNSMLAAVPVSAEVTKESATSSSSSSSSSSSAAANGRRPPLPPLPAPSASSSTSLLAAFAARGAGAAASASASSSSASGRPPVPAAPLPNCRSGSSSQLNKDGAAAAAEEKSAAAGMPKDEEFSLFYDASIYPAVSDSGATDTTSSVAGAGAGAFAEGNEVLGLIAALLCCRGWTPAKFLLNLLEAQGCDPLLLMSHCKDLRDAMAALSAWQLDALYCCSAHNTNKKVFFSASSLCLAKPPPPPSSQATAPSTSSVKQTSRGSSSTAISAAAAAATADVSIQNGYERCLAFMASLQDTKTALEQLAPIESLEDFPLLSAQLLSYLGYHVHGYTQLFARLCRLSAGVVRSVLAANPSTSASAVTTSADAAAAAGTSTSSTASAASALVVVTVTASTEQALQPVASLLCDVLLPALSACPAAAYNPALAAEVWAGIKLLPFALRFTLYDRWYGAGKSKSCDTFLYTAKKNTFLCPSFARCC
jgi:trimeric autotransporter adhesin